MPHLLTEEKLEVTSEAGDLRAGVETVNSPRGHCSLVPGETSLSVVRAHLYRFF